MKSPEEYANEAERIKAYDLAIADEHLLEYVAEGKSYSYLCKMAERYGKDPDIVADRVAPKYAASGKDGKVRIPLTAARTAHFSDAVQCPGGHLVTQSPWLLGQRC